PAPDYDGWLARRIVHQGVTWQGADWFFAGGCFYRLLLQAVRWRRAGRGPFARHKLGGYPRPQVRDPLRRAAQREGRPAGELVALLEFALWGNRVDRTYALAASHGQHIADDDLMVDDHALVVDHLLGQRGTVHVIADNAGTELAMDMALIDALLAD